MSTTDGILLVALGLAGLIFWRLHARQVASTTGTPTPPDPSPFVPPGSPYVPLGQFSVSPDRQWLLIQPGQ